MKLFIPPSSTCFLDTLAEESGLVSDDLHSLTVERYEGWQLTVDPDSDQPPAVTKNKGVIVGKKWIISVLATEWATAALEGQKEFRLDGDRLYHLVERYRRQLAKQKAK